MKYLLLLLFILSAPSSAQNLVWAETSSGIGVPFEPSDIYVVRVQTPRKDSRSRNYPELKEGKWYVADVTLFGVPVDAVGVCLLGTARIDKGDDMKSAQISIYIRAPGVTTEKRVTWEIASPAGAGDVRGDRYVCVGVIDGYFEWRWEPRGWCPRCRNKSSSRGLIDLRINTYYR